MSNDEIGLVLVGLTIFFALLGYVLSREGLKTVEAAAKDAQSAANEAKEVVASAQVALAEGTGAPATALAATNAGVLTKTTALSDGIGQVNDALAALTGRQAPARVAWALCALSLVAAFIAFDLVSVAVAPDATVPEGR